MIIKILEFSKTTAMITCSLYSNSNTSPMDLTSATLTTNLFKLVNLTNSKPLSITAVSIVNPTSGTFILSTSLPSEVFADGDTFLLSKGLVDATTPLDEILNTAILDTGLGAVSTGGSSTLLKSPIFKSVRDKKYNLEISAFNLGTFTPETSETIVLTSPITVRGTVIDAIRLTSSESSSSIDQDADINVLVEFLNNGNPIEVDANLTDILSLNLVLQNS